jgi:hypothetical protein
VVFPIDGFPTRALATSGPNILMIKKNLHLSTNNGKNFNPRNLLVSPQANGQGMMLDVPSHGLIYLASAKPGSNGLQVSDDHGLVWDDDNWDVSANVTSFTQRNDGKMYAIDNSGPRIFEKLDSIDSWTEVSMVTPLPSGNYFLTHFNNVLIAAETSGAGVYHSDNAGVDWVAYAGLPTNQEVFSAAGPHGQTLLVGTDSAGIYRLNAANVFVPANNGLEPFTTVYGIVGKQDIYKNEIIKQYIYIATSKGLFRSEDLGQNWTLARPGDIRVIY